jgi:uncharacterized protein (TIGR02594 family)
MNWMEIAWEQEGAGVAEIGGPAADKKIVSYFHGIGRSDVTSDEVPWCAASAFWCLQRAGVSIVHIPPEERLLAVSALKVGHRIDGPRVGALRVSKRNGGYHVGFVTAWTAGTVTLLGGNQSDKFCAAPFKRRPGDVYIWPAAAPATATTSRIVKIAQAQKKDAAKGATSQVAGQVPVPDMVPPPDYVVPSPAGTLPDAAALADQASLLQTALETGISFAGFVAGKWPWIMLLVGLYYVLRMGAGAWLIKQFRQEDAATGKTLSTSSADTPPASLPAVPDEQEVPDAVFA